MKGILFKNVKNITFHLLRVVNFVILPPISVVITLSLQRELKSQLNHSLSETYLQGLR